MKTLYEILEVSENASNEIIEKAYKVLAKKYHPDLQTPENKKQAENKMKEINEAYEILSDAEKRKAYDSELSIKREEEKRKESQEYNNYTYDNNTSQQHNMQDEYNKMNDMQRRRQEEKLRRQEQQMRKQMEKNLQEEYENAYYQYLRDLGYRIKERWTWKKTKDLILALIIIAIIITILWFIPATNKLMVDFYESNQIVKVIVDVIINIGVAIGKTIESMFSSGK